MKLYQGWQSSASWRVRRALANTAVRQAVSPDVEGQRAWAARWIHRGLRAYEVHVAAGPGWFRLGDELTMADLYLAPQVRNAERYGVDLTDCPRVLRIHAACLSTPEADRTQPSPALVKSC